MVQSVVLNSISSSPLTLHRDNTEWIFRRSSSSSSSPSWEELLPQHAPQPWQQSSKLTSERSSIRWRTELIGYGTIEIVASSTCSINDAGGGTAQAHSGSAKTHACAPPRRSPCAHCMTSSITCRPLLSYTVRGIIKPQSQGLISHSVQHLSPHKYHYTYQVMAPAAPFNPPSADLPGKPFVPEWVPPPVTKEKHNFAELKSIDLSLLDSEDPAVVDDLVQQVKVAIRDDGFLFLENYGVSLEQVSNASYKENSNSIDCRTSNSCIVNSPWHNTYTTTSARRTKSAFFSTPIAESGLVTSIRMDLR